MTGAGARAPRDRSHCPRCRTGQQPLVFTGVQHSLPHLAPGSCRMMRSCGLCLEAHSSLRERECGHWRRSTPRSRAGSAELQEDAVGPAGRPEDLLPTVHEDELPPLPDPQVQRERQTWRSYDRACAHARLRSELA